MSLPGKPGSGEILKEVLLFLSKEKLAPTPANFRYAHERVTGRPDKELIEISQLKAFFPSQNSDFSMSGSELLNAIRHAAQTQDACSAVISDSIGLALAALLTSRPELRRKADLLQTQIKNGAQSPELASSVHYLFEQCSESAIADQALLAGLRRLLDCVALSVEALAEDKSTIQGQVATLRRVSTEEPLTLSAIREAETVLMELAAIQSKLKNSLIDSRREIKDLIREFVSQVGANAGALGEHSQKMESLTQTILSNEDLPQIRLALNAIALEAKDAAVKMKESHARLAQKEQRIVQAQQQIDELQKELAQVSQKVKEDALTGALNRRGLEEAAAREISLAARGQQSLCLAVLDIDDFKIFNDQLGHTSGDEALQYLVATLKGVLRPADCVARFGGEEFVLLLPHSLVPQAESVLMRAQRALTRDFWMQSEQRLLTFSSGLTQWEPSDTLSSMIARADRLMYRAKRSGKNQVAHDLPSSNETQ